MARKWTVGGHSPSTGERTREVRVTFYGNKNFPVAVVGIGDFGSKDRARAAINLDKRDIKSLRKALKEVERELDLMLSSDA